MSDEILTLPEVAQLLKVAEKTVYSMAQKGLLPAFKVGGQWRFKRADLDQWIEDQKAALCFDLRRGTVEAEERARSQCDIALHSQALWFAFKFTWGFGTLEVSGRYTRINPKVDKRALYLCHLYSTDIHFQGLPRRLLERRVWSFCWTKRHEVLNRLLGR